MFFDSDLDIVGLYAMPKEKQSTGAKPLSPNAYYIRLMQRVISALEAPTSEGILYKTDTRLRPSGADGPLAASLDSYFAYQQKDAWVWEHMSLIRSRAVYAAAGTAKAFETKKKQALSVHARGNDGELRKEMLDMRARVEREFGSKDPWNLKYARGGIMDIMFAAHFLMLKNGVFHADLGAGLALLHKKKLLSKKDFDILHETLRLAEAAQGFLRLTAELPFMPEKSAGSHKQALVLHALPKKKMTFAAFERQLKQNCAAAYAIYKKILK